MVPGATVQIAFRKRAESGENVVAGMIDDVAATLERHHISAEKGPVPIPSGGGGGGGGPSEIWMIGAVAPIAAFFTAIASEAGKDAWRRLKALLNDLHNPSADTGEVIRVEIKPGDGVILIPADLPDEAYDELVRRVASGEDAKGLQWDPDAREWRPR